MITKEKIFKTLSSVLDEAACPAKIVVDIIDANNFRVYIKNIEKEDIKADAEPDEADNETCPGNTAIAYVDGSFSAKTGTAGYGAVILHDNKEVELSGSITGPDTALHNVAGELTAVLQSCEYAVKNHIQNLVIYYDYSGIEFWITGAWMAKNSFTRKYVAEIDHYMNEHNLSIAFKKVEAHTGDFYNERADALAKKAAGI